jgi:hypothetical protein
MRSSRNPSGSVGRSVGNHAGAGKPSGGELAAGDLAAGDLAAGDLALDEGAPESKPPVGKTMVAKTMVPNLNMPRIPADIAADIPMEWLDTGNWRLPSGKALAEFALQAGFLAPLLFGAEEFGRAAMKSRNRLPGLGVGAGRAKNCSKGAR